jgi:hypothetical protein
MNDRDEPLKDEAAKRGDWRGEGGPRPVPHADGYTLPASEDEDERGADTRGGKSIAHPGTISAPD